MTSVWPALSWSNLAILVAVGVFARVVLLVVRAAQAERREQARVLKAEPEPSLLTALQPHAEETRRVRPPYSPTETYTPMEVGVIKPRARRRL